MDLTDAPDPLPTVTDSATAFEERLAFFEQDGTAHVMHPSTLWHRVWAELAESWRAGRYPNIVVEEIHPPFRQRLTITTPEDRLAARVAHGYEDQEVRP